MIELLKLGVPKVYVNEIMSRKSYRIIWFDQKTFMLCFGNNYKGSKNKSSFTCRYVSILVELTRIEGTRHGKLIANQMLDVAIRVQAIRSFAVSQMVSDQR